uniref:Uncharacterized protein n=1 Tax=Rhodosorus marinus TaxID=101924 RepID=A0A6T6MDH9_9RHOD|mmetsp:Transcript_23399/g.33591  ORF Transcript_23399/g.33591 Transcript_23399/m.33591 type:complete len:200 (+) Transcript_23399:97-696(+)
MYYDTFATEANLFDSRYCSKQYPLPASLNCQLTACANVRRYPEALKIVDAAHQSGIPLAVATSSSTGDAERVLNALKIRSSFKFVVGRDQVGRLIAPGILSIFRSQACCPNFVLLRQVSKAKPDPEIYLKAAKLLGASPEKSLAFEDSVTGLTAGLAAQMHVVAIASPFTKDSLQAQEFHPQQLVVYDAAAVWNAIHVA